MNLMTRSTAAITVKKHSMPMPAGFELRSVMLVAALAVGAAVAADSVHAQGTAATPSSGSKSAPVIQSAPPNVSGQPPAAVPANRATVKDVEAAFNRADANHDGKLDRTEAEHLPAVAARFETIDTDRDTFISLAELSRAATGS